MGYYLDTLHLLLSLFSMDYLQTVDDKLDASIQSGSIVLEHIRSRPALNDMVFRSPSTGPNLSANRPSQVGSMAENNTSLFQNSTVYHSEKQLQNMVCNLD